MLKIFFFILIFSQKIFALEIFCKSLGSSYFNAVYSKEKIQTSTGLKDFYLPQIYETYLGSTSTLAAGENGAQLQPGQCSPKSVPFASRYKKVQLELSNGNTFTQTGFKLPNGAFFMNSGFSYWGGTCCQIQSFEAEIRFSGDTVFLNVNASIPPKSY